ncbi:MAG: hypothetical protein HY243_09780 [Proteobacteria bacterium]|nr:hypothetical protein [Pseudomonadota bacterium]
MVGVPRDHALLQNLRAAFGTLPAVAVDEVLNYLAQVKRYGADKEDKVAILNGRFEVYFRELAGVVVLFTRDLIDGAFTLVSLEGRVPQKQVAVDRCALALGVVIESTHIFSERY